jgi:septum formation protein
MQNPLVLASGSSIRAQLLRNAKVPFDVKVARIDEEILKASLISENARPRDIADALADAKARKVAGSAASQYVLGCDQVLSLKNSVFNKPETKERAREDLLKLRGRTHELHSAAVLYYEAAPIWRFVGTVQIRMRNASDAYVEDYIERNWDSIKTSVGGYKLEEEGSRLILGVQGDYFHVLGLPLLELLTFLTLRGVIEG